MVNPALYILCGSMQDFMQLDSLLRVCCTYRPTAGLPATFCCVADVGANLGLLGRLFLRLGRRPGLFRLRLWLRLWLWLLLRLRLWFWLWLRLCFRGWGRLGRLLLLLWCGYGLQVSVQLSIGHRIKQPVEGLQQELQAAWEAAGPKFLLLGFEENFL